MKLLMLSILTVSTLAHADRTVLTRETIMYPGANADLYLSIQGLLGGEEARAACPNGVAKARRIESTVDADFEVNGLDATAVTYPIVSQRVVVECK